MAKKQKDVVEETTETKQPEGGKARYEMWRMEWVTKDGKKVLQKLKMERNNVLITQEQADTLNSGAQSTDAINSIMYFLPGQDA